MMAANSATDISNSKVRHFKFGEDHHHSGMNHQDGGRTKTNLKLSNSSQQEQATSTTAKSVFTRVKLGHPSSLRNHRCAPSVGVTTTTTTGCTAIGITAVVPISISNNVEHAQELKSVCRPVSFNCYYL